MRLRDEGGLLAGVLVVGGEVSVPRRRLRRNNKRSNVRPGQLIEVLPGHTLSAFCINIFGFI